MDSTRTCRRVSGLGLGLWLAIAAIPSLARADSVPLAVADATLLVTDLSQSHKNVYGSSPSYIHWQGVNSEARTVSSTFVTLLLQHAHGLAPGTFASWLGTPSPDAATYFDAIVAQNHITRLDDVTQVRAGDLIAIRYPAGSPGSGQLMIVLEPPQVRVATPSVVPGTTQYEVAVIDSSSSPHGPSDTRVVGPAATGQGIGKGTVRLYVNAALQPVGYSWSTLLSSHFYPIDERSLVIGRINFDTLP